jgi:GntR family transcriptional regulator, transcriptional repressor for pyruvate dehydrogenase complex
MLDLDTRSAGDLLRLRLWLEDIGAREAATREPALSGPETGDIEAALGRLRQATGSMSELIAADTVFHATVVRGAGNPYLAAIYESVHSAVLAYQFKGWVDSESVPPWLRGSGPERHWALHEPIARAVIGRDGAAAQAAVLGHHEMMAEHLSQR